MDSQRHSVFRSLARSHNDLGGSAACVWNWTDNAAFTSDRTVPTILSPLDPPAQERCSWRLQPRDTAEPGSEMHARKAGCLLQCRQGSRAHEPGLDIVDGSLESSVPRTARYQQVSPQQACREGTSGG